MFALNGVTAVQEETSRGPGKEKAEASHPGHTKSILLTYASALYSEMYYAALKTQCTLLVGSLERAQVEVEFEL